jgi:glycosyltransferase involved in cell wall biosynthesis
MKNEGHAENMSKSPLVSFVVPCYKLAHLLAECVNSILAQDFLDFEVLIMDNCSPDNTPEVAQSFNDSRVKHIRNESNLGHIPNYNKGVSLTRGKYVWVLSADDTLRSPHVLGRFVEAMERNPRAGFVYCRSVELRGGKEAGVAQWADGGNEDRVWTDRSFFVRLLEYNCIVASSVLMRKECYEKVGPFQLDLPFACDWHMWCMLAMNFDVAYLSEPMVCCRFHDESLTTLYYQEHTRNCVGDELSVLWRVGSQANRAGLSSMQSACKAALARRAVRLLMAELKGETPSMSEAEFEEILKMRIKDLNDIQNIRASVYAILADQLYNSGEFAKAAHYDRLGLAARPWNLRNRAKYLLRYTVVRGNHVSRHSS